MKRLTVAFGTIALLTVSMLSNAQVADCDLTAGSPMDPARQGPGVSFAKLNPKIAIAACQKAVTDNPTLARSWFQYGRALEKGNRIADAITAYNKAAQLNSGAAYNNLGELYRDGKGFQKDLNKAEEMFTRSAELQSPEGRDNLLALSKQIKKTTGVAIPNELIGVWAGKGSSCIKELTKKNLSSWYGMVFTSSELKKGRVSDYVIGADICIPQKVTGNFPTYTISFDCKPGDNAPYETIEKFTVTGNQLSIDLNGITYWQRCPNP